MKAIIVTLFAASLVFVSACQKEEAQTEEQPQQMEAGQHEGHDHEGHQHEVTGGGETMAASFHCPMKCEGEKTYTEQGTCPACNMDLVEMDHKDMQADHKDMQAEGSE